LLRGLRPRTPLGARLPPDPPAGGIGPPYPAEGVPPSALPGMEECTYFWGVNTSWGINTAESKRPINQEDNQAPQPTLGCAEMDPSATPDASMCTWNSISKLGYIRIGAVLRFSLSVSNALSHSAIHQNVLDFFNNFSNGGVLRAYLLMNL
jgi:hypothetical protein